MADHEDEETFEGTASGSSATFPLQCSALRKGGFVVIKGKACKIVDMSTSKTGKHGHAKVHLTALDIFENKKLEENCPSTHNVEVPRVSRVEYEVMSVDEDGFFSLMTQDGGETKDDVKFNHLHCTPGTLKEVQELIEEAEKSGEHVAIATVMSAMGIETVKEVKKSKQN